MRTSLYGRRGGGASFRLFCAQSAVPFNLRHHVNCQGPKAGVSRGDVNRVSQILEEKGHDVLQIEAEASVQEAVKQMDR
jgi:hypothetical protein